MAGHDSGAGIAKTPEPRDARGLLDEIVSERGERPTVEGASEIAAIGGQHDVAIFEANAQ